VNTRETTWFSETEWSTLARLVALMGTGLLVTNLGMPQWITGPLVNALLILAVLWGGVSQAIFVGMVTPLGAALSGTLPLPLLVMIPFIALGNAAFVSTFSSLYGKNRWLALAVSAVVKAGLLYVAVSVLVARPLSLVIAGQPQSIVMPGSIVNMMGWTQVLTALAGGLIAFGVNWSAVRLTKKQ
jgi:hypothetical protein